VHPTDKNGVEIQLGDSVTAPIDYRHWGEAIVIMIYPNLVWVRDPQGHQGSANPKQIEVLPKPQAKPPRT
jgi:hypothetical protein